MKPSDLSVYLTKMIKAKRNVLVKGSPGTGKTAIAIAAIEAAESLGILMYPSVGNPTEPRGFPWLHNGRAEFIPFGELRQLYEVIDSGKLVTLFLDDLGQGTAATQAGYMSLLDKIRGRCAVIAATNERGHTGVQGILEPVKSRFAAIVEMVPDLDDFTTLLIKHGEKLYTLSEEAILDGVSFLRFRPDLLCNYQPTADLTNSPCPRTWVAALQTVTARFPTDIELEAISGAIGAGAGQEFVVFKDRRQQLPPIDDILKDPTHAVVPTEASIRWAVCTGLAARATVQNFPAVYKYAELLYDKNYGPFAALLIKDCTQRKPELMETDAFQKLAMSDTIGALIAGR